VEVNGGFFVALRLLPRLPSHIIAAMKRCLPTPGIRPNPAFNADAPSAWLHASPRMRASSRCCVPRRRGITRPRVSVHHRAVARLAGAPVNSALSLAPMVFLLGAPHEVHALCAPIRDAINRVPMATTARHVVAFVLALSFPPARSIARADVAASCLYVGPWPPLRPGASRGRLGRGIVVVPRLLLRLASRVIEAYVAVSCLDSGLTRRSTRTRLRRGFTRLPRMRASSRCCTPRWRAG